MLSLQRSLMIGALVTASASFIPLQQRDGTKSPAPPLTDTVPFKCPMQCKCFLFVARVDSLWTEVVCAREKNDSTVRITGVNGRSGSDEPTRNEAPRHRTFVRPSNLFTRDDIEDWSGGEFVD